MNRKPPKPSAISAAGIREDVLNQKLSLFFGSNATFELIPTQDGIGAYLISSNSGVKATQAIVDDLRTASRKADENDKKASYKTQSNPKPSQQYGRSPEQNPYPPRRHDSYNAKSDFRQYASNPSPAFSPHDTSVVASPRGMQTRDDVSRAPRHYDFNDSETNEGRKSYRLFPEEDDDDDDDDEESDSPQQSAHSVRRPPRHDSIKSTTQVARSNYALVGVDSQRGTSAVPIRQAQLGGQDHYQEPPESQYRSRSQKRTDTEARHKPELLQARQPPLVSQSPQASYLDQNRSEEPYAGSYPASTTYLPGQAKTQSDFKDFRDWQEYRRQRDAYEHAEPQRPPVSQYDEQYDTPPPRYSEAEPRQHKPRQPSPDTHGQNRGHPQGTDKHAHRSAGRRKHYR